LDIRRNGNRDLKFASLSHNALLGPMVDGGPDIGKEPWLIRREPLRGQGEYEPISGAPRRRSFQRNRQLRHGGKDGGPTLGI
jgi:hypothetical protein